VLLLELRAERECGNGAVTHNLPESFFLTGTNTGVGKTFVACGVVRERRRNGRDCIGMKPICCGERQDAELLAAACGGAVDINAINPVWLRTPAAPYVAGMVETREIDLALVRKTYERLRARHTEIVVEGVGGWRVPITREIAVSDLAAEMGLPVVVVAANRLGALNHTLLTVESIRSRGLECAGVILNHVQPPSAEPDIAVMTNGAALRELLGVRVLVEWTFEAAASGLSAG
jgi:dethiobiotin synthetase